MLCLFVLLMFCGSFAVSSVADNCNDRVACVERELVRYVDEVDKTSKMSLMDDVVVLEKNNQTNEEPKSSEGIIERCIRFLSEHELKIRIPPTITSRTLTNEARTRKLKKIILPILIILKLGAAIIFPLILAVIGFTAFKGFGVSLMALTVASVVGLKNLIEGHHHGSRLTYEIVPQVSAPYWSRNGIESYASGYHTIA